MESRLRSGRPVSNLTRDFQELRYAADGNQLVHKERTREAVGLSRKEEAIWPHGATSTIDQAQASYAHSNTTHAYFLCGPHLRTSLTFNGAAGKRLKGFARA
jgi:hypothetical protein